jgi:hypothetical protein
MVVPRSLHTATLLQDGRVLIVGGVAASGGSANYVVESEIYDPAAGSFTAVSNASLGGSTGGYMTNGTVTTARFNHAACLLTDGRVLIAGGYGEETVDANGNPVQSDLATAFTFDPKTNSFTQVGSLNTARRSLKLVAFSGGAVAIGGFNATLNNGQGGTTNVAEVYDPTANTFTATGNLNTPRQNMGAALLGGLPTVVGGLAIIEQPGQTTVSTLIASGCEQENGSTWVAGAQPVTDRYFASFDALSNGTGVLAGGQDSTGASNASIERLSAKTFSVVGQLSTARQQHGSAAGGLGVLFAGGINVSASGTFSTLASAEYFNAVSNSVTSATMAHQRNGCAVVALQNGTFLVTGGTEGGTTDPMGLDGTSVGSAEIFAVPGSSTTGTTNPGSTTQPKNPASPPPPPAPAPAPSPSPAPAPAPPPAPSPAPAPPPPPPPAPAPAPPPPPPPPPSITWTNQIQSIFNNDSCLGCHSGGSRDLSSYQATMRFVTAGNPSGSTLYQKVSTGSMSGYTNPGDAQTIYNWIKAGAPQ